MPLIQRLHDFFTRIGVSPKVADPFIAAVALIAFELVTTGTLDVGGLRLAVGLLILGIVGVSAPPAAGVTQRQISNPRAPRARRR